MRGKQRTEKSIAGKLMAGKSITEKSAAGKTMAGKSRTGKLLLAVVLSVLMLLAAALPALAATITVGGGAAGSEYAAYRLLDATDGGEGKFAYTLNDKYADILKKVTTKTDAKEIVGYIAGLDASGIRAFADDVYGKIAASDSGITADKTAAAGSEAGAAANFTGVEQGYYLIVETKTGTDKTDTYSLVMLDTAGKDTVTVATKESAPTVEKKVKEKNDTTGDESDWQDAADYDGGDHVPFKLTGTVSSHYANYKTYSYVFHDKLSAGLTLDEDSVVVKVDGTELNEEGNYTLVTSPTECENGCSFEARFTDLKKITGATVTKDSTITVEYTATLDAEKAEIGSTGNPNEVMLEYNNNPYYVEGGTPSTGKTPGDKVTVFTYRLVVNKVAPAEKKETDGNDEPTDEDETSLYQPLKGAGFTLYKHDKVSNDYVSVGAEQKGTEDEPQTTFTFSCLDAGQYKLVETTVPDGYNKADDLIFVVEAVYDTESADPKLTGLVVKNADGEVISAGEDAVFTVNRSGGVTSLDGTISTDVINNSGTELPSTGGRGTVILYVAGVILTAGAAILLIAKKRAGSRRQ